MRNKAWSPPKDGYGKPVDEKNRAVGCPLTHLFAVLPCSLESQYECYIRVRELTPSI